jgi:hypothetical protein
LVKHFVSDNFHDAEALLKLCKYNFIKIKIKIKIKNLEIRVRASPRGL